MGKVAQSDVWFLAGESFEEKMLPKVKEQCPGVEDVSLVDSLPGLLKEEHCCHHGHSHSMIDNHVWLSPFLYLEQGKIILETLVKRYPEKKIFFEGNYNVLVDEVNQLDFELNQMRKKLPKDIAILVSHPAFSYFSIDYDLLQLSVEQDGREPQPKDIEKLIRQVSDSNVVCVLLQEQYNNKGTRLIAEYLSLPMYTIDPYDEDALATIRELGNTIFISKE
jgi:zinc transport system substrate-binding protein